MSIAGQENINIGLPNESANSDSLYAAFKKTQNNFTRLFSNSSQVVAGNGITIDTSGSTANISANIAAGNNITVANVNTAVVINAIVDRYSSNSTSNISLGNIGTTRTLTIGTGLSYTIAQKVIVAFNSNTYMKGNVYSYNPNTGVFSFTVSNVVGTTGEFYQSWQINLEGISEAGAGVYGVLPGNGILINSSNVTGVYSGNATISLAPTSVTAGSYRNPNITIDSTGRVTNISNNDVTGTVTSVGIVSGGNGLSVAGSPVTDSGTITITNTGVTKLLAGSGITLSAPNGEVTISQNATGYVTSVGISSNTGLLITGTNPVTSSGTIYINLPNNLTISGNITANGRFIGNGSGLSNIPVANITGIGNIAVSNYDGNASNVLHGDGSWSADQTTYSNSNVAAYLPTYTGNLASGNADLGNNVSANYFTGNGYYLTGLNLANVVVTTANYAAYAGNITIAAQPNITSVGTLSSLTVTTNVATGGIKTDNYYYANGVAISFAGSYSNSNVASYLPTYTGNIAAGNANVTGQLISTVATGTAPIVVTSTTQVANLNAATSGTVRTAAQPNITSVGTLTSLAVTGNVTAGNVYANSGTIGTTNLSVSSNSISLGNLSNANTNYSVSIGYGAGNTTQTGYAVAIGYEAGQTNQALQAIAIGARAGYINQGENSIAIGANSAAGNGSVAIGYHAGDNSVSYVDSVAIGFGAANNNPGNFSVAIGYYAGNLNMGIGGTAVGYGAGANAQGSFSVAVGFDAGANTQGSNSVAIGTEAGFENQGNNAIAIGKFAGYSSQANNTIILNATGSNLNVSTANTFTVKPIRSNVTTQALFYNTTTGEISYDTLANYAGNITANVYIKTVATTFATLPSAATVGAGARAFITDGNLAASTNFGAQVTGGAANGVPVYSDGTVWRIG
jgi:hypothetical protein